MTTRRAKAASPATADAAYRGQRVGYLRVSSLGQSTERQLDGVPVDAVFEDKASGASTRQRPQLELAIKHLRAGDVLVVHSMDRLARNLGDLLAMVEALTGRGVAVEFVKERQTFQPAATDPMATLMLQMLGAFAQFERAIIRERQREGIELAKGRGVYKGRAPKLTPDQVQALRAKDAASGGKGRAALAREAGISRETLYRYLGAAGSENAVTDAVT